MERLNRRTVSFARKCILGFLFCVSTLFFGCASNAPKKQTEILSEGGDSLRVKFTLEIPGEKSETQKFSAVLFSVPMKRYRLELSTTFGVSVASLLWTDSLWTITFPTEKAYLRGNGYLVGNMNRPDFPLINIHQVARFFEQKFLPENYSVLETRDSLDVRVYLAKDEREIPFRFAKQGDSLLYLEQGGERVVPEWPKIEVFKDGNLYLRLVVKEVLFTKSWSGSTWRLRVPFGYSLLE